MFVSTIFYKLAATNGYSWNFMVYTGKQDPIAGLGQAQIVVMDLMSDLLGCYRTVVADNFLTSISLAERWLEHDTYRIGTLRSNRVGSGTKFFRKNSDVLKFTDSRIKTSSS
jgi:hypothetical protein